MKLKQFLKLLTPPLLVDVYRASQNGSHYSYIWKGIYESFDQIATPGLGYASNVWIESVTTYTKLIRDTYKQSGISVVDQDSQFSTLASLTATLVAQNQRASVLDFGGGMGIGYLQLLYSLPAIDQVEYTILDSEQSCAGGAQLFANDRRVRFISAVPERMDAIDILFMSASLQYVADYRVLLRELLRHRPRYFLCTKVTAGNIPTYAAAQMNVKDTVIPCWFFNLDQLVQLITDCGYVLLAKEELARQYNQDNYPQQYRLGRMRNLLFVRTDQVRAG